MNLIILTDDDRLDQARFRLTDLRADHIRNILRLGRDDRLEVGILDGGQGTAIIEKITESEIIIGVEEIYSQPDELYNPAVDLICALPRPQTLKKVLITCGMMGVRRLFLIRANRVEKSYFHSPLLKPENMRPFLLEGLSQGKLTRLPGVSIHERFKIFFQDTLSTPDKDEKIPALKLLPHSECSNSIMDVLDRDDQPILLAVGPEGGWVPFEVEMMSDLGFRMFKLGPWILRVEHALTASLAQIQLAKCLKHE